MNGHRRPSTIAALAAGLAIALDTSPWLILVGAACIAAGWFYTGGSHPYGYLGLGEVFVFVFFGLVAVGGTAYLQAGRLEPMFIAAAIPVGALTTAILVVNNLRDIPTDAAAGKRTLAVVLGRRATLIEYELLLAVAFLVPVALAIGGRGIAVLLPVLAVPLARPLLRTVRTFSEPRQLNLVLKGTARLALIFGLLFGVGLSIESLVG